MDDDNVKAVVPEQAVDANPTDPPKIEPASLLDVRNCAQTPAAEPVDADAPLTLKIKVHGEEKEVSLTRDELIKRIQLAEDYQLKTQQLAEDKRKIAPYLHVFKSDAFHAWLADQPTEGTKHLADKDLHGLMKKGMTIAAVELILRRGREAL